MTKQQLSLVKRCVFLFLGMSIIAFGIAFSIKAGLGTSPVSSLPYVLSLFTPLTVGTGTILLHSFFILLQILILRREYNPAQLLQLPVAMAFGYLTDLAVWLTGDLSASTYAGQWFLCIVGIILVGVGVSFEVTASVITLAAEGFALAVCKKLPIKFGDMKVAVDVSLVVTACVLSFLFLHRLAGIREGTVAAAIFVGIIAKQVNKPLKGFAEKYLY
jgi:uncharacterized membrane protein YczE